jgi:hypothetical protein
LFQRWHAVQQGVIQQLQDRISKELKVKDDVKAILAQIIPAGVQDGTWHPALINVSTRELRKGIEAQARIVSSNLWTAG